MVFTCVFVAWLLRRAGRPEVRRVYEHEYTDSVPDPFRPPTPDDYKKDYQRDY